MQTNYMLFAITFSYNARWRCLLLNLAFLLCCFFVHAQDNKKQLELQRFRYEYIVKMAGLNSDIRLLDYNKLPSRGMFTVVNGKRVVTVDSSLLLANIAVFESTVCHELGHDILNHTGPSDSTNELAADFHCGYLMRIIGWNRVEDAYSFLGDQISDPSHASNESRQAAIHRGWDSASFVFKRDYVGTNPLVTWAWEPGILTINIDDRQVKLKGDWNRTGVYYDSTLRATFELMNFKKGYQGLGRLVNATTPITYKRQGDNDFLIYEYGEIVPRKNCAGPNYINSNGDLVAKCYSSKAGRAFFYTLIYYKLAHNFFLMPAYINPK